MHQPRLRWIEAVATMHGAAVVPHDDVADFPLLHEHAIGRGHVLPQPRDDVVALIERHADDPHLVGRAADVERLAAGLAMRAHDGMSDAVPLAKIGTARLARNEAQNALLVVDALMK